jgi:PKD repeat protein
MKWRRAARPKRRRSTSLCVRQLERRRVLDAAIGNLAVSSLVANDTPLPSDASTGAAPAVFNSSSFDADVQSNAAGAQAESQQQFTAFDSNLPAMGGDVENPTGVDTNVRPVLVVALDQTANEGQPLNLSGIGGAPPLGLFVDTDFDDTHTATVHWGDGSGIENATIFAASGSGALGGSHVYADDGLYQVTVTVTDDHGASDTKSFNVTVNNVRPVLVVAIDQNANEGQPLNLSGIGGAPPLGLFVDSGVEDTHTATVNWGDGTATEDATIFASSGSGALGGSHTYIEDGVYTVTVSVFDDDGGSDTKSFNVTVNNVRPVLVVATNQATSEGSFLNLSGIGGAPPLGLFVDDGVTDTHMATVSWGDGTPTENATIFSAAGAGALGGSHTYLDNGTYTVTVNVLDDDGGSDTETFQVLVENVAPTATLSNNGPISAGSSAEVFFNGPFDPGTLDTAAGFHYAYDFDNDGTFDVGDGTYAGSVTNDTQTVPAAFLGDGTTHTVRARILDKDGGFSDYTTQIEFRGGPPALVNIVGDTINEKQTAMIFARILDASASDVFEVDVDWKDGATATIIGLGGSDVSGIVGSTQYQWTAETRQLKLSHQYVDDNPTGTPSDLYSVTLAVHDSEENSAGPFTAPVTVINVRPVLVVAIDQTVNEYQELDLSAVTGPPLGLFVDDGVQDSHMATVNWGDGSDPESTTIFSGGGAGALGGKHTYADDGVYTVTVTVTDDDGGSDTKSFTVTVNNVRPVVVVAQNQSINEGEFLDLSGLGGAPPLGLYVDPGLNDTHTATVDWGDGSSVENAAIFAGPGSGALGGSHTYADNGVYTVTVTVTDDDGGSDTKTFQVTVNNVAPSLTNVDDIMLDEGALFSLEDLNLLLSDPGFDFPVDSIEGFLSQELFAIHSVDWGDGRPPDTDASIIDRISGAPSIPTTATIGDAIHAYADNGTYIVTLRVADDDMGAYDDPSRFSEGVDGVDYVDLTFTIVVNNVAPALGPLEPSTLTTTESNAVPVTFTVSFSDPGFDNPLNGQGPEGGGEGGGEFEVAESFTYDIDWGDGRQEVVNVATPDMNGGPGIASTGSFGSSHIYADDGQYTVTVRIHDDDGGSHIKTFIVTVTNVDPSFVPVAGGAPFEGDEVTPEGITRVRVSFNDPGFDNPNNPNSPSPLSITDTRRESFTHLLDWSDGTIDAVHTYADAGIYTVTVTVSGAGGVQMFSFPGFDSGLMPVLTLVSSQALHDPAVPLQLFTYTVDWGDGAVQTIPLALKSPGIPVFSSGLTTVISSLRASGEENVLTAGAFEVEHRFDGPPNPVNPAADIPIRVTIVDDNNGSVTGVITVANPIPPATITTPALDLGANVLRLELLIPVVGESLPDQQTSSSFGFQSTDTRVARSELTITSDVFLELEVISPDDKVISTHQISDEALLDLRKFFATLPDGRYRIYLVRTDNNSRRFIMEVYVRNGRVIDPGDDSDGTRDRPPTSEETIQVEQVPLEQNPLLERVPNREPNDAEALPNGQQPANPQSANEQAVESVAVQSGEDAELSDEVGGDSQQQTNFSALRSVAPLVGLAFVAAKGRRAWSQELDAAFGQADDHAWRRLRRAARLGRPKTTSASKTREEISHAETRRTQNNRLGV